MPKKSVASLIIDTFRFVIPPAKLLFPPNNPSRDDDGGRGGPQGYGGYGGYDGHGGCDGRGLNMKVCKLRAHFCRHQR